MTSYKRIRAIEDTIEDKFCTDNGEIIATEEEQRTHLINEQFTLEEINEYFKEPTAGFNL